MFSFPQNASTGELFYIFLLWLGIAIGLAIVLRSIFRFGLPAIAVRPIVPFAIVFSIIHFATPLLKFSKGLYRYQTRYSESTMISVALLSLTFLMLATFLSSTRQFSATPVRQMAAPPSSYGGRGFNLVAQAIYVIGGLFALQDVHIITNEIGYHLFLSDIHAASETRSSLRVLANLMILGAALLLGSLLSKTRKGKSTYLKVGLVVTPVIAYAIFINSRNTMFITAITLLTVYLGFVFDFRDLTRRKRPLAIKKATLYRFFFLIFLLSILYFLFSSMSNQRYNVSDSDFLIERRENAFFYSIDGAFGNDENLLWLFENNDYQLLYGRTYLAGLLVIIPRAIWPDKPLGAGPHLINLIRPGSYVEGAYGNNSLTTGLFTESMMNFSFLGMFGGVVFWAFLTSRLIRAFHRSANFFYRTAFLICALLISTAFLYQEFLGLFARSFVLVAPLFITGFLLEPQKTSRNVLKDNA